MKIRQWIATLLLFSTVAAVGCELTGGHNLPPASRLAQPGPGVGGPGPGVLTPPRPPVAPVSAIGPMTAGVGAPGAVVEASGIMMGGHTMVAPSVGGPNCLPQDNFGPSGSPLQAVQVLFSRPESMQVQWDVSGVGQFDSMPLVTPGRQDFTQGGIYRLKLTSIENREGVELYPTLEIGPPRYRSMAYLAHNAIPIQFTEEDFDQVLAGNFVTKVVYLPDPEFQGVAVADVATLVSTPLDPGLDPIEEATEKGVILAVIRIGNKDMETPGGQFGGEQVTPAGYGVPVAQAGHHGLLHHRPMAVANTAPMPPGGMPADLISGVNMPQYGMTMSGTPIGLPGPPHIPMGVPAGLKRHVMKNWTSRHIPDPVKKVKINVKQRPGLSYPHPPSKAWITEDTIHPTVRYGHHYGAQSSGQVQHVCGPSCGPNCSH
ncbi:MAG: hypothetical protein P8N76_14490 [Pirellulaceae bacterium]|nr:hypothetical protein [Pirellulaceae bacterium]